MKVRSNKDSLVRTSEGGKLGSFLCPCGVPHTSVYSSHHTLHALLELLGLTNQKGGHSLPTTSGLSS